MANRAASSTLEQEQETHILSSIPKTVFGIKSEKRCKQLGVRQISSKYPGAS